VGIYRAIWHFLRQHAFMCIARFDDQLELISRWQTITAFIINIWSMFRFISRIYGSQNERVINHQFFFNITIIYIIWNIQRYSDNYLMRILFKFTPHRIIVVHQVNYHMINRFKCVHRITSTLVDTFDI